ncbi:hypothetical protein APY04_0413 [Hyphomicrobium sulfonivorans]|uniref:Uncharacterized protein n=1 Tax=Hyphomicrobium sulfonivorans TaxID=121290 RepID=A0A125NW21_HYPSL|nr:hypothetical protein [Hyphomicrobium sulfonivorans]KWT71560.1 hypothetical protein APY04_0413 [Hyphomicrobium sulfonivorans]
MRIFRWIMMIIVAICVLPFICTLLADMIVAMAGCDFNLGASQTCAIGGLDIGPALYFLAMQGYALFFTVPVLILTLPLWAIVEIVHWLRARHAARLNAE